MMRRILVTAAVFLVLASAVPAAAQWQIKVGDEANIKFGFLLQGWADWAEASPTVADESSHYAQNLFLRRVRLIAGGNVTKNVSFFFETDNPNLGKATATGAKGLGSGFIVQDAFLSWNLAKEFSLQGGLILVPFCRNCLSSAAGLIALDYGSYSFLESAPTQSVVGRDTGFQARGFFLGNHLEYRIGGFQGIRAAPVANNSFRSTGRVQYNVCDTEDAMFYPGTYFGKKKVIAFGAGYDTQSSYFSYSGDGFFDWPMAFGSLTAEADFIHWDGGRTFTTLKRQNTIAGQAGVYFAQAKVMPFLRVEHQHFTQEGANVADQTRYQAGLGYYYKGNNAHVKLVYSRIEPKTTTPTVKATNEFTLQLQAFYF